jgi:hypothetical protein
LDKGIRSSKIYLYTRTRGRPTGLHSHLLYTLLDLREEHPGSTYLLENYIEMYKKY